jgi:arylsulfatase
MDVLPTFLSLAGIEAPENTFQGREILPIKGASMTGLLEGDTSPVHADDYAMGWELRGNAAIRKGDWKIVRTNKPLGDMTWKLFNLANDPAETTDLSQSHPEKFAELLKEWDTYVADNGVYDITEASTLDVTGAQDE